MKKYSIKILSGHAKNKCIKFPLQSNIKPTKSNVRNFFLTWIENYVHNLYVLDFFSGSGIFGFEFISREAKKVILLEYNFKAYNSILENKKHFKKKYNFSSYFIDSFKWFNKFNFLNISLIICDPPYNFTYFNTYFSLIDCSLFLKNHLLIFIETCNFNFLKHIPLTWFLIKKKNLGITCFFLFKRI